MGSTPRGGTCRFPCAGGRVHCRVMDGRRRLWQSRYAPYLFLLPFAVPFCVFLLYRSAAASC